MLTFFRKNQKVIFIFTTGVIVISFTFFGTANYLGESASPKEEILFTAIDGSSVSSQKVSRMVQFLSSSQLDLKDDRISSVNLINHGVLEKQFLSSSLGKLLAEKISSEIEPDIEKALEKAAGFTSYRHPSAPFISAEAVWAQFAPESTRIARDLVLQASALSTAKKFELLSESYLQHQKVPAGFIKKILSYQAQQLSHAEPDSSLPYADVSLLGIHSVKEWLGESYLKAAAELIINGAAHARKMGYKVSSKEAREAMVANVEQAASLLSQEKTPQTNFYSIFLGQVRNLGMNEMECIDLWKDMALFQKLIDSVSKVETSSLPEIQNMSKEQALVEKFSLPSALQFRDFSSFMKLQVYLDAVSLKKRTKEDFLFLPTETLSLSEIEKKAPELVQRNYVIECSELDSKKLASQIGLKETWAWQTGEQGWSFLKKEYVELSKISAKTYEERFNALEKLDPKKRSELDRVSREKILSQNKERIQKELAAITPEKRTLWISSKGLEIPFKGISDPQGFVSLLEKSPLQEMDPLLTFYSDNNQHYYRISVLERSPIKKVQTFAEANESGVLRRMLDKKLEEAYFEVRKKDSIPYMKKDGSWKPLAEVKEKVGLAVYAPVLKAIASEYTSFYGKEPTKQQLDSSEFYVKNWALCHLKQCLAEAKEGKLLQESQWSLHKEKETLLKTNYDALKEIPFVESTWSSLLPLSSNHLSFFKVLQKLPSAPPSVEEIDLLTAPLKKEAEKKLFQDLFSEITSKKAISLKALL